MTIQHLLWEGWYYCFSINTERGLAALVLTRKQKAIGRPSINFQQGGPGFPILPTFTLFVQPLAYWFLSLLDLFAWIDEIKSAFQNSKVAREGDNFLPTKKAKSSVGYAAEWKL